VSGVTEGSARK